MTQRGSSELTIKCSSCTVKMVQRVLRYSIEWLEERMIDSWNTRTSCSLLDDESHGQDIKEG